MDWKGHIWLFVIYISYASGRDLRVPEDLNTPDYHFNSLGVNFNVNVRHMSLNRNAPFFGGMIFMELDCDKIFKLVDKRRAIFNRMEKKPALLTTIFTSLEKLRDFQTIMATMTYKGENIYSGIFDIKMEYKFVKADQKEKTGTLHAESKHGSGVGEKNISLNFNNKEVIQITILENLVKTRVDYDNLVFMLEIHKKKTIYYESSYRPIYWTHHRQITGKVIKDDITNLEFSLDPKMFANDRFMEMGMQSNLHLESDSQIQRDLCQFSSYTCFSDLVQDFKFNHHIRDGPFDMNCTVQKDTTEIFHLKAQLVPQDFRTEYKFILKSPYIIPLMKYLRGQPTSSMPVLKSPFDITVVYSPEDYKKTMANIDMNLRYMGGKTWVMDKMPVEKNPFEITLIYASGEGRRGHYVMLQTNIDMQETMVKLTIKPREYKQKKDYGFTVELNGEDEAEVDLYYLGDRKKMDIFSTLKDGTPVNTTIALKEPYSYFQNSLEITRTKKTLTQNAAISWKVQLDMGRVELEAVGTNTPKFNDFQITRFVGWDVNYNGPEMEMVITSSGSLSSNLEKTLTFPTITNVRISYKTLAARLIDANLVMSGSLEKQPFDLEFKTSPLQFSLLPFLGD
eukprot:TRINITY_DN4931_c0_g1_i1.p1 TRINITY_DN4931_c0_g1~~TRINITY_DN4931_c0_g1_i1.p1  ORF type:complete len:622 (-),score=106.73 TRINITY_DN4931_c0_g1_i1:336-2201(-)